ncbi:hypothetical protein E3N88_43940 [Mikania micrantha]|uniref:Uncharacterized protein n=1 Tax=Mikania micrantha TaxID=192012 RepID=A0A5N6LDH0_9ASTR|nr:hypothetical protein E3N88_43940 [Mikania micrantha]
MTECIKYNFYCMLPFSVQHPCIPFSSTHMCMSSLTSFISRVFFSFFPAGLRSYETKGIAIVEGRGDELGMARTLWLTERVVVTTSEPRKQERQSTAVIHKNRFVLRHFHSIFFTERLPLSPVLSRYAQMELGGNLIWGSTTWFEGFLVLANSLD